MERHRQTKFPDPFELDEELDRKLWVKKKTIFLPSAPTLISYDIETPSKGVALFALDWDNVMKQLQSEFMDMRTRRDLAHVAGFCDDCVGYDRREYGDGTWMGINRSEVAPRRRDW